MMQSTPPSTVEIERGEQIRRFSSLLSSVEALGGTVPKALKNIVEKHQAVDALVYPQSTDPLQTVREALTNPASGVSDTLAAVQQAATTEATQYWLRSVYPNIAGIVLARAQQLIQGPTGGQIVLSLRPTFKTAAAGVHAALEHFGPGFTADQILAKGDTAIDAWRALPQHVMRLERVTGLCQTMTQLGALGPQHSRGNAEHPGVAMAAWLTGPQGRQDLAATARAWATETRPQHLNLTGTGLVEVPGTAGAHELDKWLALAQSCQLHLNTPTEAAQLLNNWL